MSEGRDRKVQNQALLENNLPNHPHIQVLIPLASFLAAIRRRSTDIQSAKNSGFCQTKNKPRIQKQARL
jgi:hypothetical protein